MGKSVYIVFLLAAVFGMSSCHKGESEEPAVQSEPVMLNIRVSLSDLLPKTRAEGEDSPYAVAANDNEKIQTLRVIVVDSRNNVEGNVFMDLMAGEDKDKTPVTEQTVTVRNVASNDVKMIYLIANEGATRTYDGKPENLVNFDFRTIKPGLKFPLKEMEALKMHLHENVDHLSNGLQGGLPMSEYHRVLIPVVPKQKEGVPGGDELAGDGFFLLDEEDRVIDDRVEEVKGVEEGTGEEIFGYRQTLWITRTAVKFTFEVTNNMANAVTLKGLRMKMMAGTAYFMPRVLKRNGHEIEEFAVPVEAMLNNEHFEFQYALPTPKVLRKGEEPTVLDPIYLLEGKYTDKNGVVEEVNGVKNVCNYRAALVLEKAGATGEVITSYMYLPNLPALPRNTHVVVRATINDPSDIEWEVDVVPYGEVLLEPGFGI